MLFFVIYCVFIVASLVQLGFYLGVFSKLAFYQPKNSKQTYGNQHSSQPVSIIICARNEAANLKKNLAFILNQDYPDFELIVVDDDSEDATADVLLEFSGKTDYLRIIKNSNKSSGQLGKKFALAKGIEAARHDILVLTDADCQPNSRKWLSLMQSRIRDKVEIGLGYAPYYKQPGLLNRFIRFETAYTAIQYLSFALIGVPYMGVGRNLVYKKNLYKQVGGFSSHEHIASGDDDLFINAVARANNVGIVLDPCAFVYSDPKKTWKKYYLQKVRHHTTGGHYRTFHKVLLGLLSTSHFLHYTIGIVLLLKFSTIFVLFIYVVRITVVFLVYAATFKKFRESDLIKWIPLLDAAYILYYVVFAPAFLFGKTEKWK